MAKENENSTNENDWDSVNQPPEHSEEDDYVEASRSTADYANYEKPSTPKNPIWRKLLIVLIIVLVIAGLGGGAYAFLKGSKPNKKINTSTQTAQTSKQAASQIENSTKHYDSSNFYLGFDYPQDWVVTDSGGGTMTVVSPTMKLVGSNNQTVDGRIVMTFLSKPSKIPELDTANAVAALPSVKIAYTKPTQAQRGSTYESFLRYGRSTSGLDAVYITGDSGYTAGQAIPKVDILKVDPVISLSFIKCANNQCSGQGTTLTISTDAWSDKTFSQPLENMLKSLSIN